MAPWTNLGARRRSEAWLKHTIDRIHDGQVSSMILRDLTLKVAERQEVILKALIREYDSGKADPQKMIGGIAAIAALRSLLKDYERSASQGIEALEEIHAQA